MGRLPSQRDHKVSKKTKSSTMIEMDFHKKTETKKWRNKVRASTRIHLPGKLAKVSWTSLRCHRKWIREENDDYFTKSLT